MGKQFHRFGQQDSIWLWNQLYLYLNKCARQKEWKLSTSSWQQAELVEKPLIVWVAWWLLLLNISCIQKKKKNKTNNFALQGCTHWSLNPSSLLYTVLFATPEIRQSLLSGTSKVTGMEERDFFTRYVKKVWFLSFKPQCPSAVPPPLTGRTVLFTPRESLKGN